VKQAFIEHFPAASRLLVSNLFRLTELNGFNHSTESGKCQRKLVPRTVARRRPNRAETASARANGQSSLRTNPPAGGSPASGGLGSRGDPAE
jgi:hypothetical protein